MDNDNMGVEIAFMSNKKGEATLVVQMTGLPVDIQSLTDDQTTDLAVTVVRWLVRNLFLDGESGIYVC